MVELAAVAERCERDGVRCSVTTGYPLECIYCGCGLGTMDSCDCDDARMHRLEQAVKAFGASRELLGLKPRLCV